MPDSLSSNLATIGILSIGDMGVGIARLLVAHNYRVITNASDRSDATKRRAQNAAVELVQTDVDLVNQSDYVLSIVPPRDAPATAKRIANATGNQAFCKREYPLYFLDLNAVSPKSARTANELFAESAPHVCYVDGGIIGGAPKRKDDGSWAGPSIPTSGPHKLADAEPSGSHLGSVLGVDHISPEVGQASGLKMCFASLTKGLIALAIQSFTTAHRLSVLPALKDHLSRYSPKILELAQGGVVGMPPKAYRWVREMEEIAETFEDDGGFGIDESIYRAVARTYALVADGTELGNEVTEGREKGKTPEDVATWMSEGIERRKVKTD